MHFAALLIVAALLGACGETRTLTLPAAPPDLFNREMPVEVFAVQAVGRRHGRVAAGASEGAGMSALAGAGGAFAAGLSGGPGGAGLVLLAPVFAAGGAIVGAAAAHPEVETKAAITAIEQVYDDAALISGLGGMIRERFAAQGFPADMPCPDPLLRPAAARSERNLSLAPKGCEPSSPKNLLHLKVGYGFRTEGFLSPRLFFDVDVAGVAMNSDRQRPAMEFHWIYRTPEMDFFAATATNAEALRQTIRQVQRSFADRIVDDLVVSRNAERVTGTYRPYPIVLSHHFLLPEFGPGVVHRVPEVSKYPSWPPNPRNIDVPPTLLEK